MDTPPVPKPRSSFLPHDPVKRPVPLPRTKVPSDNDRVSASDILRSISTVSKQITEDVAQKVTNSARSANERIEKSIIDGSKFAKGTLEKTLTTSKALRDSVTKSVIEGTRSAGVKLRRQQKKVDNFDEDAQRCVSMPVVDVSLFDNIQFHSPLLEQKRFHNDVMQNNDLPSLHLNTYNMDDLSLFSNNSDSNTDTVSNFSYDGQSEAHSSTLNLSEQLTYDTPRSSTANSIISTMSTPEVPERRKKRESAMDVMRQNSLYENWTLPNPSKPNTTPPVVEERRPSKSTIYEFDPLNNTTTSQRYAGVSNELILLESFLIGDTYGSIVTSDSVDDGYDYRDSEYFNPPTPPERSDSLLINEVKATTASPRDNNSNWFDSESDSKSSLDEGKPTNSMMQKFSSMLKLDNVLHKAAKQVPQKVEVVERPPVNNATVPYFCGMLTRIVSAVGEDLFKNSQTRYCVLSDQKLICYTDPTNTILKEAYTLDSVYSLQIVLPLSSR